MILSDFISYLRQNKWQVAVADASFKTQIESEVFVSHKVHAPDGRMYNILRIRSEEPSIVEIGYKGGAFHEPIPISSFIVTLYKIRRHVFMDVEVLIINVPITATIGVIDKEKRVLPYIYGGETMIIDLPILLDKDMEYYTAVKVGRLTLNQFVNLFSFVTSCETDLSEATKYLRDYNISVNDLLVIAKKTNRYE